MICFGEKYLVWNRAWIKNCLVYIFIWYFEEELVQKMGNVRLALKRFEIVLTLNWGNGNENINII